MTKIETITQPYQGDKEGAPLLIASVGNTSMRLVLYEAAEKVWDLRFPTRDSAAGNLPALPAGSSISLVSVVPEAADALLAHYAGHDFMRVKAAGLQDLEVAYHPPASLGADRLVNALALKRRFGCGVVVDCGTATTLTVVDGQGRLVGGAILPGLETASDSLHARTSQLPAVSVKPMELTWGSDTQSGIQVGLWQGHVGAIAHLVEGMQRQLPSAAATVLTGGWSRALAPYLPCDYRLEPDWTIIGARIAWLEHQAAANSGT